MSPVSSRRASRHIQIASLRDRRDVSRQLFDALPKLNADPPGVARAIISPQRTTCGRCWARCARLSGLYSAPRNGPIWQRMIERTDHALDLERKKCQITLQRSRRDGNSRGCIGRSAFCAFRRGGRIYNPPTGSSPIGAPRSRRGSGLTGRPILRPQKIRPLTQSRIAARASQAWVSM
jgi:hypothetical protein